MGTLPSEDGSADLSYVESSVRAIGKIMTIYKVIVHKSTLPIDTARKVKLWVVGKIACWVR